MEILCNLSMFCVCIIISLNSGIFPETAWRAILSRQAAHAFECVLWGFLGAAPGGESLNRQAAQGS